MKQAGKIKRALELFLYIRLWFIKIIRYCLVKCRNIIGISTRNDISINDNLRVFPICTSVLEIFFKRWPRCDVFSLNQICFYQKPRSVADSCYKLFMFCKVRYKIYCFAVNSQRIWIYLTSWKYKRIIIVRISIC